MNDHSSDAIFGDFINVPVIRAGRRLQLHFYKTALAPLDMSIQEWRTLYYLEQFGETHLRELARFGHLDPTHVSRTATALEDRGLIRRYDDPSDNRRKRMAITETGQALVKQVWPHAKAMTEMVKDHLGDRDFAALVSALDKILGIDAFLAEPPTSDKRSDLNLPAD